MPTAEPEPASATPPQAPAPADDAALPGRIHTWPYLVRLEFLAALVVMVVLTIWSITIDAPLEEAADPNRTPNPSKAPWYFLGLQEMLVYFDPWIAGVALPILIIVGLVLIPYLDVNPRGNGYYTLSERKFAVPVFLFGFLVLWVALIVIGTFLRGPGWNLFWPWEPWDPHKTVAIVNVDLPYQLGARSRGAAFVTGGLVTLGYWPGLAIAGHFLMRRRTIFRQLGGLRFHILAFLFLAMMSLPAKMILRLAFDTKYVWTTPWFNI